MVAPDVSQAITTSMASGKLPPVGMNVYVISGIARDVPMRQTFLGVTPFLGAELLRVAALIAFPALVLWFPRWVAG